MQLGFFLFDLNVTLYNQSLFKKKKSYICIIPFKIYKEKSPITEACGLNLFMDGQSVGNTIANQDPNRK